MRLQKRYLVIGGVVLAVLLALAAGLLFWGRRPFRDLEAAETGSETQASVSQTVSQTESSSAAN